MAVCMFIKSLKKGVVNHALFFFTIIWEYCGRTRTFCPGRLMKALSPGNEFLVNMYVVHVINWPQTFMFLC